MLLAEIVGIGEEGGAEGLSDGVVIGSGVGEDSVALADEGLCEELAEVPKAEDGDFELGGLVEAVNEEGLVVIGLGGIDCANPEARAAGGMRRRLRKGQMRFVGIGLGKEGSGGGGGGLGGRGGGGGRLSGS